ncbi:ABC transporter permease [Paenibacillus sp.]|uniref:ABC transporter permease n=1 Tax=Paenibacillus sp. TaxID=58172 RepID=UPI002D2DCB7F|nr:ABC-2 family transporter protein [Paenibacillus sp.]HZG55731.1 ABC-2 family transporter protein [Paenibacillus sp.]
MLTGGRRLRGTLAFLLTCWKLNLAGAMEFRMSFLLMAGMMVVNNSVWIFFWSLFFQRFEVVNGWSLPDVMMLWAISAGGFGIAATLFGNMNRIAWLTANGQLDVYLVQPKPVLLNVLASRMSVTAIGDAAFSVILYVLFGDGSWLGFAKYALAHVVAAVIFLFFMVIVGSLAFWIGNAEGLTGQMFNAVVSFSTYPTDIFKGWGRVVIFTVVPAGFISYMPIGLLRDAVQWDFLLGALGMSAGIAAFGTWFFYAGLRRYSSGNAIAMRS